MYISLRPEYDKPSENHCIKPSVCLLANKPPSGSGWCLIPDVWSWICAD